MKWLLVVICLSFYTFSLSAQSVDVQAQGKYYSAATSYQNRDFKKALEYIKACKILLNNKTNKRVQYLHVMTLNSLGMFSEANVELKRFFDLEEGREVPLPFKKTVDALTNDET